MQIKGIFFDLGGTLFRYSSGMGGGGIRHVIRELGIRASPEDVGRGWREAARSAGEQFNGLAYFLHKDLFYETLTRFLRGFNAHPSAELLESFHQQQLQSLLEHMPLREECHEALAQLKAMGLYLSIVSNIDDDYLVPLVEKHGLDQHLDHWTSSQEAQSCKPDQAIYHFSLNKAGLHKDEVLFVGDSLQHDVAGAAAIGMRSARIVDKEVVTPLTHGLKVTAEPTYEIAALTDLLKIVDEVNTDMRG